MPIGNHMSFFSAKDLAAYYNNQGSYYDRPLIMAPITNQPGQTARQQPSQLSISTAKLVITTAKRLIVNRTDTLAIIHAGLSKWIRPWDVVPKLANFTAEEDDFSIGIEVEMSFKTADDASYIASKVINWKHVAIDAEGGTFGLEVTFPPMLYSKFNSKSKAAMYLKLLSVNINKVCKHSANIDAIGTHINVGWKHCHNPNRTSEICVVLVDLSNEYAYKYFGRRPYGYLYNRGNFIEFKLFNSVTDWKVLRRYVDIAVALAELCKSNRDINTDTVMEALELGYNKHTSK